jgi:type II secretory pathway component PulF
MDQDYFEFKLHLQGKALEGHTIDAKELGVALIGINDSLDIIAKQMPGARQKQTSLQIQASLEKGKLFKSTLNNRLHRNLSCVIDKSSRGAKLKRAFEELPKEA